MSSAGGGGEKATAAVRTQAWSRIRDGRAFPQEVWRRGDPDLRPETGRIVLPRTSGMAKKEEQFYGRALFVNIVGDKRVTPADLLAAMELQCGVRQTAAKVKATFPPYDFFVRFDSAEDCTRVVHLASKVRCCGARVTACRWGNNVRGTTGEMEYNSVLSIEGLPEEAWEPEAINIVLAGLHGHVVEVLPAKDYRLLTIKACLHNPSDILKIVTVIVPSPLLLPTKQDSDEEGDSPSPPRSPKTKRTQEHNLIVHVKEVIDRGPLLMEGIPDAFLPDEEEDLSRRHVFKTWHGKIDGTGEGDQGEA